MTGHRDGQATLERMEGANLFTIPLDEERRWYRYHHLTADVLRGRLRGEHPDRIPELHRRASEWYAERGLTEEAVSHALSEDDSERAGVLVEKVAQAFWERDAASALLALLEALPEDLILSRPVLCVWHAPVMRQSGLDAAVVEWCVDHAERLLAIEALMSWDDPHADAGMRHMWGT